MKKTFPDSRYARSQEAQKAPPGPRKPNPYFWLAYFFVLPTLLLIGVIVFYPLVQAALLSVTDVSFINPIPKFVGLDNFSRILKDETFWLVFKNTLVWTGSVVFFQFLVGLGMALLLNQKFYGRALARGLIIIPWVTPGVIAALVWRMMYDPQLGIINGILIRLGLIEIGIPWLTQVSTVMPAVVIVAIWKGSCFSTVMYLAALQGVPEDLMDAARIDGAGAFQRLIHIIIPQIMPVVRVTVLLTVVATANYFDLIWIMTEGGPVNYTHIFPTFIYELAFSGAKTGMAAAYGLVVAGILLIFSLVYIRELNKRQALD